MSVGRMISWVLVALATFIPMNWIRLWAVGEVPKDATSMQFFVGTLACWSVAVALAYFLVVSARGIRNRKAEDAQAMQQFLDQPLTEIRPSIALIKPGEKAYGAVMADWLKEQTVGFSANTSGVSVRVAKGVTLRTGGTRGKAVKGIVSAASGELVVTDKRLIFSGDKKSFAIPLDDLLNSTKYTDGFGFSDSKATYTLTTKNDKERMLFGIALDKVLRG